MEDCFRKSIQQNALPETVYFDCTEKNTMPKNMLVSLINKRFPIYFSEYEDLRESEFGNSGPIASCLPKDIRL